jgi:hypothetical protein
MPGIVRLIRLMELCLTALLVLVLGLIASGYASGRGSADSLRATSSGRDLAVPLTPQLSAHTQAAIFPRRDVAFSLTQRVWAQAPRKGEDAMRPALAWLRLSQRVNLSGPPPRAFSRVAPDPVWSDLVLEARVAPMSSLQLSTTAAVDPIKADVMAASAELAVHPLTACTLALAPDFGDGSRLTRLHGRMQLTLPGTWTVAYTMRPYAFEAPGVSHTVTTSYPSSFGHVRLELTHSAAEHRVGVRIDLATLLRRTLGF